MPKRVAKQVNRFSSLLKNINQFVRGWKLIKKHHYTHHRKESDHGKVKLTDLQQSRTTGRKAGKEGPTRGDKD